MEPLNGKPRILPYGDQYLMIELGAEVNPSLNRLARELADQAQRTCISGIVDLLPSYCSLLPRYDPLRVSFQEAFRWAETLLALRPSASPEPASVKEIPVLSGGPFGPDIEKVARHNHLAIDEVIRLHTGTAYQVFVIGGFPGLAAMGRLPDSIVTSRLANPQIKVPAGSVAIAGRQTGIYAVESPGGWQLIGRTPLRLFNPMKNPPSFFTPGDQVRFFRIREEEFRSWVPND